MNNSCCVSFLRLPAATMDELQRKKISRKGYRSHLTRLMNKVDPIIESEERLSKKQIAILNSSIEQFNKRGALLRDIDKEIVATIQEDNELEVEIIENTAIQEAISDKISLIKSILDSVTPPTVNVSAPAFVPSEPPILIEPTVATTRREHVSRLCKLHLPTFSGNMLNWQSFWNSFNAAVHSNPVLDMTSKSSIIFAPSCMMKPHMPYQVLHSPVPIIKKQWHCCKNVLGKLIRSFKPT